MEGKYITPLRELQHFGAWYCKVWCIHKAYISHNIHVCQSKMYGIKIKHTFIVYTFENGRRGAPLSIFKYGGGHDRLPVSCLFTPMSRIWYARSYHRILKINDNICFLIYLFHLDEKHVHLPCLPWVCNERRIWMKTLLFWTTQMKLNEKNVRFAIVYEIEWKLRICKRLLNWMIKVLNRMTK